MYIPQNFLPRSRQKLLRSAPGQSFPAVAVMPLAAKVKKVMVNTGGNKRQVPAKRQNRGSRNSKDDGG
ncbi:TPA: single-stranded DNA-binding protein [Escherichia coli]|uniref:single-stranded DNA-binding protein n=1 Tax=Escherichia coli TaxID=562 RepID=UPI000DD6FFF3|nr:single-stranded DNA-binding protein [Escherichia coli]MCJ7259426.1 single-stranded DNA-binding protein [Klebsiella pneumoniae]MDK2428530.1 single-stranded DNA-binding protein [Escherichia coli]MDK2547573.1 single-stranded DNA-binding protein [Escherichia coli]MDU0220092.1 single-stranded DNA-binding protein [Escherichia coli]HBL0826677.1 single-stranded DNA-binding protein [Escherichia coli]